MHQGIYAWLSSSISASTMSSLEAILAVRIEEHNDSLCGVSKKRKIQGTGNTCFTPQCRQKGRAAHLAMNSRKLQASESAEERTGNELPTAMCVYCLPRPATGAGIVCFTPPCIRR